MARLEVLTNIPKDKLDELQRGFELDGGLVSITPQPDGLFTMRAVFTDPLPAATSVSMSPPMPATTMTIESGVEAVGHPLSPPLTSRLVRRIEITDTDLDALTRVAKTEVGHFGKYGESQLHGGLAAVVDTIFNRVAHDKYPDSIEEVVDQPKQFSAINNLGSWIELPRAPISIAKIITEHVVARSRGQASEIEGATHFLNPHISNDSAMQRWGQHVQQNPVVIYGSDVDKDVHYHGFAPGATLPDPHIISFGGKESLYNGSGRILTASAGISSHSDIKRKIVEVCRTEYTYFNHGQARETDDPQYLRVGDYWKVVGSANNGRTLNSAGNRPAWSAAFISYVLHKAGAGSGFPYAAAHCIFFQYFVERSGHSLYEAMLTNEVMPQPGDIIHYGRGDAKQYDFSAARSNFSDDGWYPSHSDIVVSADPIAKEIKAIGGNVSDSVKQKTYTLDSKGFLNDREEGGQIYPWIGILRLV